MVVVGLKALLSREVERFKRSQMREFDELPKEILKLANALVNGDLTSGSGSDFEYRSMLKELARGWEPEQVVQMMAQFPPEMAVYSTALVLKAKTMVEDFLKNYPQTNYVTATGSINLVPADKKIFKFTMILEVVADPLRVFGMMSDGSLNIAQANAVRTAYPSLSTAIDAALLEAVMRKKAATKSFELSPLTEIGVRAWFGKGPISEKSLKMSQASVDANKDRQAANRGTATAGLDKTEQTQAQRVEASM
jgi:hypothetical protein